MIVEVFSRQFGTMEARNNIEGEIESGKNRMAAVFYVVLAGFNSEVMRGYKITT